VRVLKPRKGGGNRRLSTRREREKNLPGLSLFSRTRGEGGKEKKKGGGRAAALLRPDRIKKRRKSEEKAQNPPPL